MREELRRRRERRPRKGPRKKVGERRAEEEEEDFAGLVVEERGARLGFLVGRGGMLIVGGE